MTRTSLAKLSGEAHPINIPSKIQEELLRHLSNFVSDLDKIGNIIEETKPHHALIKRWRKLKFEMEGDLNDTLQIINNKKQDNHFEATSRALHTRC